MQAAPPPPPCIIMVQCRKAPAAEKQLQEKAGTPPGGGGRQGVIEHHSSHHRLPEASALCHNMKCTPERYQPVLAPGFTNNSLDASSVLCGNIKSAVARRRPYRRRLQARPFPRLRRPCGGRATTRHVHGVRASTALDQACDDAAPCPAGARRNRRTESASPGGTKNTHGTAGPCLGPTPGFACPASVPLAHAGSVCAAPPASWPCQAQTKRALPLQRAAARQSPQAHTLNAHITCGGTLPPETA